MSWIARWLSLRLSTALPKLGAIGRPDWLVVCLCRVAFARLTRRRPSVRRVRLGLTPLEDRAVPDAGLIASLTSYQYFGDQPAVRLDTTVSDQGNGQYEFDYTVTHLIDEFAGTDMEPGWGPAVLIGCGLLDVPDGVVVDDESPAGGWAYSGPIFWYAPKAGDEEVYPTGLAPGASGSFSVTTPACEIVWEDLRTYSQEALELYDFGTLGPGRPLVTATATASSDDVDAGQAVQFTGSGSGGVGPYSYFWSFGDGGTSTEQNPSHVFGASDDGDYGVSLTVTDANGMSDTDMVFVGVAGDGWVGEEVDDDSMDPAVHQALIQDEADEEATGAAADQAAQQALAGLEADPDLDYDSQPIDTSLADELAADAAAEAAALVAADAVYVATLGTDATAFDTTVQDAEAAYDAAADLSESEYNSDVDAANAGYVTALAGLDQTYLTAVATADGAFQQRVVTDDQTLAGQLATLQTSLDATTATAEQSYDGTVAAGDAHLQQVVASAEQTYQNEVAQRTTTRDQADATAEAAATAAEQLADAAEQAGFDQAQAGFDQVVAGDEAAYAAGPDDEAATTVPDFSQDPGVVSAVAAAQAAYTTTTAQADAQLDQQVQQVQDTLQAQYDAATATYNQTMTAAAAAETAARAAADQTYDAAIAADQQTRDAAVAQAWDTYDQAVQDAKTAYEGANAQAAATRATANQAADDAFSDAAAAAWSMFDQAEQQAEAAYASAAEAARTTYNDSVETLQDAYDQTAAAADHAYQLARIQADATANNAVAAAKVVRAAAFAAADAAYATADAAAQAVRDAAVQAANAAWIAATTALDQTYADDRRDETNAIKADEKTAKGVYDDAVRAASQAFWDFMHGTYYPGMRRADAIPDPDARAIAYASLAMQRRQAQKTYVLAKDAATVTLVGALSDIRIAHQPAINAIEKAKFDGYANAYADKLKATAAANLGYDQAMAGPAAARETAKADAQKTYADAVADAGQTRADAIADAERTYDQTVTTAKRTLADGLADADQTAADVIDQAEWTRDTTVADAAEQMEFAFADAERTWKDAREDAATAEERTNSAAYGAYISAVTVAGVALDGAVTSADVTQDEADAAAGVAWTDAVAAAWETRQMAEVNALAQWYDTTTAADTAALSALQDDLTAWDATVVSAWQTEVGSVLSAVGSAVDSWSAQSGTWFASLLDQEMAAWIAGTETDVAAAATDAEAVFGDEVTKDVAEEEADDAMLDGEADDLVGTVQTEASAVVTDVEADAQAAEEAVTAEDEAWAADEQAATADAAARDTDEAAAAVTDADDDQDAEQTRERAEATDAQADQRAVAAEDDRAAKAEADAAKTEEDRVAAAWHTEKTADAAAATTRDTTYADQHHAGVVADAQKVDAAVHAGAAEADQKVTATVADAAARVGQEVQVLKTQIQTKLQAEVDRVVGDHDVQMAGLIPRLQQAKAAAVAAAQAQRQADVAAPLDSPAFNVNPTPPESDYQVAYDCIPAWETVAETVAVTVIVVGAGVIIPGAGALIAAAALTGGAMTRYYDGGHTVAGALLGSGADLSGITAINASITDRDLVSGNHLDLTPAESRGMLGAGILQAGGAALAGRSLLKQQFGGGRGPAAAKPTAEGGPPAPGAKAPPPAEATPPGTSGGSAAGKAGAAEQTQGATPCFPAGTKLRTPAGWVAVEDFRPGDEIVSRPEDRPEAANTVRRVVRLQTHSGRLMGLWVAGRRIEVTHEHPFWVVGKGWVTANALAAGDELLTSDGRRVILDRAADLDRYVPVYNLEVEADHTYFVGADGWGFDVWSHNHNGGSGANRVPDKLVGRPSSEQQSLIDMAKVDSKRIGKGQGPIDAADADAYIQLANQIGVPVRAKVNDLTGAHGYGPVPPGPSAAHIHINGEHVPVPPGYTPPDGSIYIK